MAKERYETGKAPIVTVAECRGDVVVRGWSELAVMVKGEHEAEEGDERLNLRASGSLKVWMPAGGSLLLQNVSGDAIIKGIEGEVRMDEVMGDALLKRIRQGQIGAVFGDLVGRNVDDELQVQQVMGDVALRNITGVRVDSVHGDLAIQYAESDLHVTEVMGDASLQTIRGEIMIERVQRDVNLSNLGSKLTLKSVQGDVRLKGGLSSGEHSIRAQGDIVVRWPADAPLNVLVRAPQVRNRLDLKDVVEKEGQFSGRVGDGETTLILETQGRVILNDIDIPGIADEFGAEWTGVGTEFVDMGIELAGLGDQISSELNARMAELSNRIEERSNRVAKRTERAVQRAMRQADRVRGQAVNWGPPPPPPPPAAKTKKAEGPTAEEQVKILSMLEKGIISVEEAEELLRALEQ